MAQAVQLSNVASTLLPPSITGPIFDQATESSAVMSLARRVPLSLTAQTAIPVPMDVPAAGWVSEGGSKPVAAGSVGIKTMTGKKVALLVPVSTEVARTNPAGLYDQLRQDLPTAIARAFDHAAIHGLDLRTGGAGPFSDYLKQTSNSVELGTASQATGAMYTDLVNGEKLVVDDGYDFTGFAADPKLRPLLKLNVDTSGRPIWVDDPSQGTNAGQLIGYPAFYNRGVSGAYLRSGNKVQVITITGSPTGGTFTVSSSGNSTSLAYNAAAATAQTAIRAWGGIFATVTVTGSAGGPYTVTFPTTGATLTVSGAALTGGTSPTATVAQSNAAATSLRAIGGDWRQCAYGVGMDISIRVSTEASYTDEASVVHSAFQENLVLLLVEAYYGFVVGNTNAFVAYTDAS
jgi:Phage capsid family